MNIKCDTTSCPRCRENRCLDYQAGGICDCFDYHYSPTNADRIRAMSDEELATLLEGICSARDHVMLDKLCDAGFSAAAMLVETPIESRMNHLNWLRQPAEEGQCEQI